MLQKSVILHDLTISATFTKIIKGELHAKYKSLSFERAFKMLKNDTCITTIGQAILEL